MRTDLAIETPSFHSAHPLERKIKRECKRFVEKNSLKIENRQEEEAVSKPIGDYITLKFRDVLKFDDAEEIEELLIEALKELIGQNFENILVVGLGNEEITSDAVGPKIAKKILATRHIEKAFAEKIGLKGLRSVSVISPDVLGKTGIETLEIVKGVANRVSPDLIIAVDALAAASFKRLFSTVQLCNTGISPGSGVKNERKELSEKTLGVPVIAIGVPTVVDAVSLGYELTGKEPLLESDLIVTPKDADILCHKISEIISSALNIFLQPEIDREVIKALV